MGEEAVGVVGVGLLGTAVSTVLLEAGHPIVGHDVVAGRMEALVGRGGRGARSAAEVARSARIVFTVLPTLESVEQAIAGSEGILSGASKDTIIVQMSTISPDLVVRMEQAARARGAALLDAPVSGTSAMVARRDCVITVGGERPAFETCCPILETLARKVFHVGACGMGSTVKLVTNLVMGLNGAALAEGLTLARRAGVDPVQMLEVLRHGAAASKMLEVRGQLMVEGRFDAMMKVELFLKDIRLMLEAAQALHVQLPLTGAMQQLYTAALAAGQAKDDLASIVRVYEAMAGLPPRGATGAE